MTQREDIVRRQKLISHTIMAHESLPTQSTLTHILLLMQQEIEELQDHSGILSELDQEEHDKIMDDIFSDHYGSD